MPSSSFHLISKISEILVYSKPASILDIGAGFGKYGVISREYLDLDPQRTKYPGFKMKIDALEAFKKYITPLHKFIYNKVFVGEVVKLSNTLRGYDLVLLLEVLQDLEKKDSINLIKTLILNNKSVLITIPKITWAEKAEFGNEYEIFRSSYNLKDFKQFRSKIIIKDPYNYIIFIGNKGKVKELKNKLFKRKIKSLLFSIPFFGRIYSLIY